MRVKRGVTKKARHNKLLKEAKGYRMTYSKLFKRAKEAVAHAKSYSYAHRKHRKSQMREEWIQTISSALVDSNVSYSKFIGALDKSDIEIDRKNLAHMAVHNPEHFNQIVKAVA